MELLVPHVCNICAVVDEAKFLYAGPHIKQICNACGAYVKFFSKSDFPDVKEIRLRIWSITTDIEKINSAKDASRFVSGLTGMDSKMMHWRLYLKIREMEATNA